jgi:tetratricopeptide (TPR) repeat protein
MARLAHWHGRMGNLEEATRWYVAASEELTAKEMRSFAWLELQRGALALSHGQPEEARFHYQRAETAYPGDWRADAHMAGLLAAESRWEEAAALLHSVVKRTSRPDFRQAYGELLLAAGRSRQEAQPWLDAALAAYLKTVERGMVHYYHHLADLHADAGGRPAEAVHWARKDIALRSNFSTQSALAWALLQNGEIEEAVRWIRLALSSGVRDTGIFATAVAIFEAAGDLQSSRRYTQAAEDINPHLYSFHLHL